MACISGIHERSHPHIFTLNLTHRTMVDLPLSITTLAMAETRTVRKRCGAPEDLRTLVRLLLEPGSISGLVLVMESAGDRGVIGPKQPHGESRMRQQWWCLTTWIRYPS